MLSGSTLLRHLAQFYCAIYKQRETIIAKRGKAQFYRDMQNKYKDKDGNDLIKDVKTIQGWITDWERTLL